MGECVNFKIHLGKRRFLLISMALFGIGQSADRKSIG